MYAAGVCKRNHIQRTDAQEIFFWASEVKQITSDRLLRLDLVAHVSFCLKSLYFFLFFFVYLQQDTYK
jgi:hypothetical protein